MATSSLPSPVTTAVPAGARAGAAPAGAALSRALPRIGPACYGAALVALGVQCLVRGAPVPGLEPLPAATPGADAWAVLSGVTLVVGGLAAAAADARRPGRPGRRRLARVLSVGTGGLFLVWLLALHLPQLAAAPGNGSHWTAAFEVAALGGAAWALTRARPGDVSDTDVVRPVPDLFAAGRVAYGAGLVVFGVLHLAYRQFVAMLVPAWIPGPLFWAVFTGLAHLAAGLALLSGVRARAGALWVGAMFGLWVLIVHAPRVAAAPADPKEWASLFVALAMCGGAWALAGRLGARGGTASATAGRPGGAIRLRGRGPVAAP